MRIIYTRYGDGSANLLRRDGFARIEAQHEGCVVADGVMLDMRGAQNATSLFYPKGAIGDGIAASISLIRSEDGEYICEVIDTQAGASERRDETITDFPYAIVGEAGQSVTSVDSGSITLTSGLRLAYHNFYDTAVKLSLRLQERARAGNHPPDLVRKAEAWIYYSTYAAAYMVGNNAVFSYAQKLRWATTGIAIMKAIIAEQNSETLYTAIDPIDAIPATPLLVVDPTTGNRIAFANAVVIIPSTDGYPELPSSLTLTNESWIDALTVSE
ncbi:MAG: hypothetical protein OXE95_11050 [Chloroflexi bacterium]|nr:hypothetical protein [Chloroflexota bacterium]